MKKFRKHFKIAIIASSDGFIQVSINLPIKSAVSKDKVTIRVSKLLRLTSGNRGM